MDATRALASLSYDLRRKWIDGHDYLYQVFDRGGNGKSLGPMMPERDAEFAEYHSAKDAFQIRVSGLRPALAESGALCRALGLPQSAIGARPMKADSDECPVPEALTVRTG